MFSRSRFASALTVRTMSTQTISPWPNAPEVKIQANITTYDAATEKRMAALAASEGEESKVYDPAKLYADPDADVPVPKYTTDFWKLAREACVH